MQIEIVPQPDGTWNWQRREGDEVTESGPGFSDRALAIEDGREAAGAETVWVKRSSAPGSEEEYLTAPTSRVVLLNLDGREVGELDPAPGNSSAPIQVTLTPAGESSEGVEVKAGEG